MNYIIKTIQGCNLACIYCYEQPQNRLNRALDIADARLFLQKVHDYYARHKPTEVLSFHWHGGEPMLRGAAFFEQIITFQRQVFGDHLRWCNSLQSNLTLLDDAFIELFKKYENCLTLGISFDFFGHDRVDPRNRSINEHVWRNIRRLQEAGVQTNFVTMLTRGNVEHLDELYELLRSENISIRFNQVFGAPRRRRFNRPSVRLRNSQFREALTRFTRRWLDDGESSFCINNAERIATKIINPSATRMCWYEKNCLEEHMAICPDGTVFPCDSFYVDGYSYGNILRDDYESLLASSARQRLLQAQAAVTQECEQCEYLKYCNGGCPTRSIFGVPRKRIRLRKDPLCAAHRDLFEMIGSYLVEQGVVPPDWTQRAPTPESIRERLAACGGRRRPLPMTARAAEPEPRTRAELRSAR